MPIIKTLELTGTTDAGNIVFEAGSNVIITFNSGTGTVTQTMLGTTIAVRDATTASEAYYSEVFASTFTLSGGSSADITITANSVAPV